MASFVWRQRNYDKEAKKRARPVRGNVTSRRNYANEACSYSRVADLHGALNQAVGDLRFSSAMPPNKPVIWCRLLTYKEMVKLVTA